MKRFGRATAEIDDTTVACFSRQQLQVLQRVISVAMRRDSQQMESGYTEAETNALRAIERRRVPLFNEALLTGYTPEVAALVRDVLDIVTETSVPPELKGDELMLTDLELAAPIASPAAEAVWHKSIRTLDTSF